MAAGLAFVAGTIAQYNQNPMTLNETLNQLKAIGDEKVWTHNTKYGAGDNQSGVKHGDIRVLAKKIKIDDKLALSLWETGNVDAPLLAI